MFFGVPYQNYKAVLQRAETDNVVLNRPPCLHLDEIWLGLFEDRHF